MAIRFPGIETADYAITLYMTMVGEGGEKK